MPYLRVQYIWWTLKHLTVFWGRLTVGVTPAPQIFTQSFFEKKRREKKRDFSSSVITWKNGEKGFKIDEKSEKGGNFGHWLEICEYRAERSRVRRLFYTKLERNWKGKSDINLASWYWKASNLQLKSENYADQWPNGYGPKPHFQKHLLDEKANIWFLAEIIGFLGLTLFRSSHWFVPVSPRV